MDKSTISTWPWLPVRNLSTSTRFWTKKSRSVSRNWGSPSEMDGGRCPKMLGQYMYIYMYIYMEVSTNGVTLKWLVYFMENPIYKWMIPRGTTFFWKPPFGCCLVVYPLVFGCWFFQRGFYWFNLGSIMFHVKWAMFKTRVDWWWVRGLYYP